MVLFKKHAALCILLISSASLNDAHHRLHKIKYIIWDLGSTLTQINHLSVGKELGAHHIASMFWHVGKPSTMRRLMFEALESYGGKQQVLNKYDDFTCDDHNIPLPHFMSDTWFCSRIPNKEIIQHIARAVDGWKPDATISQKQKELLKRTLRVALSASVLGKHTLYAPEALVLVEQFAHKGYQQYILSNFEKEAFEKTYANKRNAELFKHFPRKNIVVSGDCQMIKPHRCIYAYFLDKYNLNAEECLLIDDRPENVIAARKCGMQALLVQKGRYKELAQKLQYLL